jgi:hypothetical protein
VSVGRPRFSVSVASTATRPNRSVTFAIHARSGAPLTATMSLTFVPGVEMRARATAVAA